MAWLCREVFGEWTKYWQNSIVRHSVGITAAWGFIGTIVGADSELRGSFKDLRQKMTGVLMANSEIESNDAFQSASKAFEDFMVLLGKVLRSNY